MANIAEVTELASALQTDVDTATANLLLLDLAQGLIVEKIGVHDPWPTTAKAIALAAAARAYSNPDGLKQETTGGTTDIRVDEAARMGVYLTKGEKQELSDWLCGPGGSTVGKPQGSFPAARSWPDPAEPCWY